MKLKGLKLNKFFVLASVTFVFLFSFLFLRFTIFSTNNVSATDCVSDDDCEWDVYGVVGTSVSYNTHGEGTELWHRPADCVDGTCQLGEEEILTDTDGNPADCTLLNEQICGTTIDGTEAVYSDYYSVEGVCCELSQRDEDICHGDSFCVEDGDMAECQSNPTVDMLEVTELQDSDYCNASEPLGIWLFWEYNSETGDSHKGTALQVREGNDNFSDIDNNLINYNKNEAIGSYPIDVEFGKTYYWRVKVWDENDNDSGWVDRDFDIGKKRADVDFDWVPQYPFEDEELTRFENKTIPGDYGIVGYYWTFENGDPPTYATNDINDKPEVVFEQVETPQEIKLQVEEDVGGIVCEIIKVIEPRPELPDWREIDPFN